MVFKKVVAVSSACVTLHRPPAGLAFLAGVLEHNNIDYEVFDLNLFLFQAYGEQTWEVFHAASIYSEGFVFNDNKELENLTYEAADQAADIILSHSPDLIAFTILSYFQFCWIQLLLEKIKEKKSTATIIAGGPGVGSEQPNGKTIGKILLEKNLTDYYIIGEGDWAFNDFLNGRRDFPGLNHKNAIEETWVPQLDSLVNLILPTYKKIKLNDYGIILVTNQTKTKTKKSPTINITGSRGCVRRCTFCDIGAIWKKFRFRPAEDLVLEIKKHHDETNCINYYFNDSLINGSLKQFKEFMGLLLELKEKSEDFKKITYAGQFIIRPKEQHSEKMYELMSQSGCEMIQVGIESGSEKVRLHMGKKFSNEDIDYHFEMCSKYNIKNFLYMFMGYPTETLEDFNETLEFFYKNQKYLIDNTIIGTNVNYPMTIFKDTPIYEMTEELGIETNNVKYDNISNWTIASNPDLTVKERYRRLIKMGQVALDLMYPISTEAFTTLEHNIGEILTEIKNQNKKIYKINSI